MANPFTKNDPRINRRGRPRKGMCLTSILEKHLKKKGRGGAPNKEALVAALIELALEGRDIHAIKYIMDRIDGKPRESVELSGDVGGSALVQIYMPDNGRAEAR